MGTQAVSNVTALRDVDLNRNQLALIRRTLAADTNDDEFDLFIEVARRMKADPFRKHLYALVFNKNDADKRKMSIVTGIDFYRVTAARNGDYRPDDARPNIVYDEALKSSTNPLGIDYCEVKGFKLGADKQWYPVVGVAYWAEYVPLEEVSDAGYDWIETDEKWPNGKPKKRRVPRGEVKLLPKGKWKEMGRVMIAKCAEANMLRKGWPEDLSGLYVEEEMDRARADDMLASEAAEKAAEDKRLAKIGAHNAIMICWGPGEPLTPVPLGQFADRAMEWLRNAKTKADVLAWQDTNRMPLREFWAKAKSDGLAINEAIEGRIKELEAA